MISDIDILIHKFKKIAVNGKMLRVVSNIYRRNLTERTRMLDQCSGDIAYKSVHFNATFKVLSERLNSGYHIIVDIEKGLFNLKGPPKTNTKIIVNTMTLGKNRPETISKNMTQEIFRICYQVS